MNGRETESDSTLGRAKQLYKFLQKRVFGQGIVLFIVLSFGGAAAWFSSRQGPSVGRLTPGGELRVYEFDPSEGVVVNEYLDVKNYSQLTLFTRVEQPSPSPTPSPTPATAAETAPGQPESQPAAAATATATPQPTATPATPSPAATQPAATQPSDPGAAAVIVQGSRDVDGFEEIKRVDSQASSWTRWEQPLDYASLRLIVEGPRQSNSVVARRVRVIIYLTPRPNP